ncbi:MAG: hypothetical protein AAGF75_05795 [Cyanobacteria bacterium P01_H01_bin.130]
MSFLKSIMSAVEDPNTMGSMGQVAGILSAVNGVANQNGVDANTMQSVVGVVGKYVQGGLKARDADDTPVSAQDLVSQFAGTQPNEQALNAILSAPQVDSLVGELEGVTGLEAGTIRGLLPMAVPLVLNLLKTGETTEQGSTNNSLVSSFIDQDGDGDTDLSDIMGMANMASKFFG